MEVYLKKILLIDDDNNIRGLLYNILHADYEVLVAEDAKSGIAIYKQTSPDVILLDIMLPDSTGIELLQKFREKDKKVKIIMITAYETIKSVIDIMDIKISGYITKPFIVKDVKEIIRNALLEAAGDE